MVIALGLCCLLLGNGPASEDGEKLSIRAEERARMVTATLAVGDPSAKPTRYSGVPLAAILAQRARAADDMAGLRDLSDAVLLVRGADGYQAAVSAAAVLMDPRGERYLLASHRDGESRPLQLIIPGDPRHVRWVKDVVAVRLVRLHDLVPPER